MQPTDRVGRGVASARAALAGNPSDGYGGAVIAVTLDQFRARASARAGSVPGASPDNELVDATIRRFSRDHCPEALAGAVEWETAVPRGVGLGGSSAIVIATLRALCELHGTSLDLAQLATLALAGLQDRVAQSYGGLTFMDFGSGGGYEPLDGGLLPPVVVAWRGDTSGDSGIVHGDLRSRFDAGEPVVVESMTHLAELAREAREALVRGDHAGFAACVDASFDAPQAIMVLDERHVAMIERARACGAAANYTGSGGAIAAVCRDESHRVEVTTALRALGCGTVATGASGGAAKPGA